MSDDDEHAIFSPQPHEAIDPLGDRDTDRPYDEHGRRPLSAAPSTAVAVGRDDDPDTPPFVVVCPDCQTYYDAGDGWTHCPQCGGETIVCDFGGGSV